MQQQRLASIRQRGCRFNPPGDFREVLPETLIALGEDRLQLERGNSVEGRCTLRIQYGLQAVTESPQA